MNYILVYGFLLSIPRKISHGEEEEEGCLIGVVLQRDSLNINFISAEAPFLKWKIPH